MVLLSLDDPACRAPDVVGGKAARLAAARAHGLPVLPGLVVPVEAARRSLAAGCAALGRGSGTARRAAMGVPLSMALERDLAAAVDELGGLVIVRSSSPLESDPSWSGAFSSLGDVKIADVGVAVRSCWSSAFAVDPLQRLAELSRGPSALRLAVLLQPQLEAVAGGTARWAEHTLLVDGVRGHPGGLLSGWVDGHSARVHGDRIEHVDGDGLDDDLVLAVARLMRTVHDALGDDTIEWIADPVGLRLVQSHRMSAGVRPVPEMPDSTWPPAGAARFTGIGAVPGDARGEIVRPRPHQTLPAERARGCIIVIDRPYPAYAPLLFAAAGLVTLGGPARAHLIEVAESLGVPTLVRVPAAEALRDLDRTNERMFGAIDTMSGQLSLWTEPPAEAATMPPGRTRSLRRRWRSRRP
ncbi:PEP/pyruvate-binding domain-containing protein [Jiangella ureilytica]|nr:PEP/pyruvate-binding domain-containing protein [Jiangella ureilytica]